MKILMISHEYPPIGGGGANACMNLAREFAAVGNEVDIVTAWFQGEKEYIEKENTRIYRLKSKRKHAEHCGFPEMLDFIVKAKPVVSNLEKERKYDICFVFFGIPSGPLGYYLKKKYKLAYVIRFGGGDIPGFQDRFAFVYKIIAPAIKVIWKNADALVANSIGLKNLAEGFYDKCEIGVIPNGADINAFADKDDKTKSKYEVTGQDGGTAYKTSEQIESGAIEEARLLFVSRLIERKGLQDILPQLRNIISECKEKNINVHLDIVGDGPYREILEAIVKNENLSGYITFHGQKTKDQLPEYYSKADIFLFPSRKEGMPNAVLEAMSYGLPIIMTPCQGSDELIDGNGYVIKAADFGEKIKELCLDHELREKMGQKSFLMVRDVFSWKATADKYMKLFKKITYF